MKIIRQFKQGRSTESIINSMTFGDVFILRDSYLKYILTLNRDKLVVVNKLGIVTYNINDLVEFYGGITAIYHKDCYLDHLEDKLIQAEKDLRNIYGED